MIWIILGSIAGCIIGLVIQFYLISYAVSAGVRDALKQIEIKSNSNGFVINEKMPDAPKPGECPMCYHQLENGVCPNCGYSDKKV